MPRHVTIVYRCPFSSDSDSKYQSKDWEVGKKIRDIGLGLFGLIHPFYDIRVIHGVKFLRSDACVIANCKYEPGTPEAKKAREKMEEIIIKELGITRDKLNQYLTQHTVFG